MVPGRGGRFHADWKKVGESVIASRAVHGVKDFSTNRWKVRAAMRAGVGVVF
jgi:hypothetical protein